MAKEPVYCKSVHGDALFTRNSTVRWNRLPGQSYDGPMSRYLELQMRFTYRDISLDTIGAMLKDMEAPAPISKGILTRITASVS